MNPLEYASKKRNRVYKRKFDHDLARQMRAEGMSYSEIARRLGVTPVAVNRVCEIATRISMDESTERFMRRHRELCAGGCGRLLGLSPRKTVKPGEKVIVYKTRTGYCRDCWNKRRVAASVRDDELRCTQCGEWKPDDEFRPQGGKYRRWRSAECRECESGRRKEHRSKNYEHEQQVWKARYRKAVANGR